MFSNSSFSEDQKDDDDIRCPKCMYYFSSITKPYILPCNHNICLDCIDLLIKEANTFCPLCNNKFNQDDRNNFQVNFGFLNLILKILKTKIIFCKHCNKVFYLEEHYDKCNQNNFTEPTKIFKEIKETCEEGEAVIKTLNNNKNFLINCKIDIYNYLKNILDKIDEIYNINTKDNIIKLFNISSQINFFESKTRLVNFLKICLTYPKYFNTNEINEIQKTISCENNNTCFHTFTSSEFQNFASRTITSGFYNTKKNSNINVLEDENSNCYKKTIEDNDIYDLFNDENDIGDEIHENIVLPQNHFDKQKKLVFGSFRKKSNMSQQKKNNNVSLNNNRKSNTILKNRSSSKINKIDAFNFLEEDSLEETSVKKIIVGLKDVKIISDKKETMNSYEGNFRKTIKNINQNINKKQYIFSNADNKDSYVILNGLQKFNDKKIINRNNNFNDGNPSLKQLCSKDFCNVRNLKNIDNYNNIKKTNTTYSQAKEYKTNPKYNTENLDNENAIRVSDTNSEENLSLINNEKEMNKLIKNFNSIKDIINELNNYTEHIDYLYNILSTGINSNLIFLENKILYNYRLLLNEIANNFSHNYRRYLISYKDNSKIILIYDVFQKKFTKRDFTELLQNYSLFNKSISIEYDGNDLIYISGGIEQEKYTSTDLFLVISRNNNLITNKMPFKKSFHCSIFFNKILYIIGGIGSNQKCNGKCAMFNTENQKWENLPSLNIPRYNSSICIYNKKYIYIFCGRDDNILLNSIEFLDINNIRKKWILFKPVDYGFVWFPVENSLVIPIEYGKILICGGEDIEGNLYMETFLLDIDSKSVYRGLDLKEKACFKNQGIIIQNCVFCMDWKNDEKNGNNRIHCFDIQENIWNFY